MDLHIASFIVHLHHILGKFFLVDFVASIPGNEFDFIR